MKNIRKASIEDTPNDLLVEKRRRSESNLSRDEQQVTLNELIKDVHRLAAKDFTTLIILYMAATLFFSGSKSTVPWYLMKQIANLHQVKRISWAKVVRQFLMESLDNFRLNTPELQVLS